MKNHCQSCAAPLNDPAFQGSSERYCRYCTDKSGKLISRAQAVQNVMGWFKTWQPETSEKNCSAAPSTICCRCRRGRSEVVNSDESRP
jgi:Putative zinc ribbon domain